MSNDQDRVHNFLVDLGYTVRAAPDEGDLYHKGDDQIFINFNVPSYVEQVEEITKDIIMEQPTDYLDEDDLEDLFPNVNDAEGDEE